MEDSPQYISDFFEDCNEFKASPKAMYSGMPHKGRADASANAAILDSLEATDRRVRRSSVQQPSQPSRRRSTIKSSPQNQQNRSLVAQIQVEEISAKEQRQKVRQTSKPVMRQSVSVESGIRQQVIVADAGTDKITTTTGQRNGSIVVNALSANADMKNGSPHRKVVREVSKKGEKESGEEKRRRKDTERLSGEDELKKQRLLAGLGQDTDSLLQSLEIIPRAESGDSADKNKLKENSNTGLLLAGPYPHEDLADSIYAAESLPKVNSMYGVSGKTSYITRNSMVYNAPTGVDNKPSLTTAQRRQSMQTLAPVSLPTALHIDDHHRISNLLHRVTNVSGKSPVGASPRTKKRATPQENWGGGGDNEGSTSNAHTPLSKSGSASASASKSTAELLPQQRARERRDFEGKDKEKARRSDPVGDRLEPERVDFIRHLGEHLDSASAPASVPAPAGAPVAVSKPAGAVRGASRGTRGERGEAAAAESRCERSKNSDVTVRWDASATDVASATQNNGKSTAAGSGGGGGGGGKSVGEVQLQSLQESSAIRRTMQEVISLHQQMETVLRENLVHRKELFTQVDSINKNYLGLFERVLKEVLTTQRNKFKFQAHSIEELEIDLAMLREKCEMQAAQIVKLSEENKKHVQELGFMRSSKSEFESESVSLQSKLQWSEELRRRQDSSIAELSERLGSIRAEMDYEHKLHLTQEIDKQRLKFALETTKLKDAHAVEMSEMERLRQELHRHKDKSLAFKDLNDFKRPLVDACTQTQVNDQGLWDKQEGWKVLPISRTRHIRHQWRRAVNFAACPGCRGVGSFIAQVASVMQDINRAKVVLMEDVVEDTQSKWSLPDELVRFMSNLPRAIQATNPKPLSWAVRRVYHLMDLKHLADREDAQLGYLLQDMTAFVIEVFLIKFESRKEAERELYLLVNTLHEHYKTHPLLQIFARCLGVLNALTSDERKQLLKAVAKREGALQRKKRTSVAQFKFKELKKSVKSLQQAQSTPSPSPATNSSGIKKKNVGFVLDSPASDSGAAVTTDSHAGFSREGSGIEGTDVETGTAGAGKRKRNSVMHKVASGMDMALSSSFAPAQCDQGLFSAVATAASAAASATAANASIQRILGKAHRNFEVGCASLQLSVLNIYLSARECLSFPYTGVYASQIRRVREQSNGLLQARASVLLTDPDWQPCRGVPEHVCIGDKMSFWVPIDRALRVLRVFLNGLPGKEVTKILHLLEHSAAFLQRDGKIELPEGMHTLIRTTARMFYHAKGAAEDVSWHWVYWNQDRRTVRRNIPGLSAASLSMDSSDPDKRSNIADTHTTSSAHLARRKSSWEMVIDDPHSSSFKSGSGRFGTILAEVECEEEELLSELEHYVEYSRDMVGSSQSYRRHHCPPDEAADGDSDGGEDVDAFSTHSAHRPRSGHSSTARNAHSAAGAGSGTGAGGVVGGGGVRKKSQIGDNALAGVASLSNHYRVSVHVEIYQRTRHGNEGSGGKIRGTKPLAAGIRTGAEFGRGTNAAMAAGRMSTADDEPVPYYVNPLKAVDVSSAASGTDTGTAGNGSGSNGTISRAVSELGVEPDLKGLLAKRLRDAESEYVPHILELPNGALLDLSQDTDASRRHYERLNPDIIMLNFDVVLQVIAEAMIAKSQFVEARLRRIFEDGDVNKDGVLSFNEFFEIVKHVAPEMNPRKILKMFREALMHGEDTDSIGPDAFLSVCKAHGVVEIVDLNALKFGSLRALCRESDLPEIPNCPVSPAPSPRTAAGARGGGRTPSAGGYTPSAGSRSMSKSSSSMLLRASSSRLNTLNTHSNFNSFHGNPSAPSLHLDASISAAGITRSRSSAGTPKISSTHAVSVGTPSHTLSASQLSTTQQSALQTLTETAQAAQTPPDHAIFGAIGEESEEREKWERAEIHPDKGVASPRTEGRNGGGREGDMPNSPSTTPVLAVCAQSVSAANSSPAAATVHTKAPALSISTSGTSGSTSNVCVTEDTATETAALIETEETIVRSPGKDCAPFETSLKDSIDKKEQTAARDESSALVQTDRSLFAQVQEEEARGGETEERERSERQRAMLDLAARQGKVTVTITRKLHDPSPSAPIESPPNTGPHGADNTGSGSGRGSERGRGVGGEIRGSRVGDQGEYVDDDDFEDSSGDSEPTPSAYLSRRMVNNNKNNNNTATYRAAPSLHLDERHQPHYHQQQDIEATGVGVGPRSRDRDRNSLRDRDKTGTIDAGSSRPCSVGSVGSVGSSARRQGGAGAAAKAGVGAGAGRSGAMGAGVGMGIAAGDRRQKSGGGNGGEQQEQGAKQKGTGKASKKGKAARGGSGRGHQQHADLSVDSLCSVLMSSLDSAHPDDASLPPSRRAAAAYGGGAKKTRAAGLSERGEGDLGEDEEIEGETSDTERMLTLPAIRGSSGATSQLLEDDDDAVSAAASSGQSAAPTQKHTHRSTRSTAHSSTHMTMHSYKRVVNEGASKGASERMMAELRARKEARKLALLEQHNDD